jgi:ABC-type transport system involved in multi-copper enzyme maturation permease subunit
MTTATIPAVHARATVGPRFANLLRSERTKLRTLRSTWWSLGITVVLSVGLSILATSLSTANWATKNAVDRQDLVDNTIGQFFQSAFVFSALALVVLGVMSMASEHTTGMIKATVLAAPRRTPVLAAKAVVLAVTVFVLAEIMAFIVFPIDAAIVHKHARITLGTPDTIRVIIGFGVVMAMIALIGLALGTLLRHTAAGLSVALGVNLVLPVLLGQIPGSAGQHLSDATPEAAGQLFLQRTYDSTQFGPWTGLAIITAWTAVLLGAAFVSIRRRDV